MMLKCKKINVGLDRTEYTVEPVLTLCPSTTTKVSYANRLDLTEMPIYSLFLDELSSTLH